MDKDLFRSPNADASGRSVTKPTEELDQENVVTGLHQGAGSTTLAEFVSSWQRRNQDLMRRLPTGTVVAVNIADGRHVTGRDGLEAMDEFERVYGLDARAWVFEVGVPITIGGGLCALSSEA